MWQKWKEICVQKEVINWVSERFYSYSASNTSTEESDDFRSQAEDGINVRPQEHAIGFEESCLSIWDTQ